MTKLKPSLCLNQYLLSWNPVDLIEPSILLQTQVNLQYCCKHKLQIFPFFKIKSSTFRTLKVVVMINVFLGWRHFEPMAWYENLLRNLALRMSWQRKRRKIENLVIGVEGKIYFYIQISIQSLTALTNDRRTFNRRRTWFGERLPILSNSAPKGPRYPNKGSHMSYKGSHLITFNPHNLISETCERPALSWLRLSPSFR